MERGHTVANSGPVKKPTKLTAIEAAMMFGTLDRSQSGRKRRRGCLGTHSQKISCKPSADTL